MPVCPLPEAVLILCWNWMHGRSICHWNRWKTGKAVPIKNDCVDLTPWVREDILLGFPQHPLCRPDCGGLKESQRWQGH